MSYESYYENINGGSNEQKPPRSSGRIILLIIAVGLVFFISGILITGLIQSAQQPWVTAVLPTPEAVKSPSSTIVPSHTPFPVERPMVDLDGQAPFLQEGNNPIPDIVDAISPSIVGVINYTRTTEDRLIEQGMGSGFFISSQGHVVTNAHVVQNCEALSVTLLDGKELDAELIAKDEIGDIAVLLVKDSGVKPLKLGDSDNIRVGEYVVTAGNPLGRNYEGTVTMGIISARSRAVTIDDQTNTYIQTDAAINVGNSGGPLLNMKGEVIGINTAKTINAGYDEYGMQVNAEGLGFALPINRVRAIVEQLITKGYVEHAALGVHIRSLSRQETIEMDLSNGILVVSVVHDGPAEAAGLLPGDVILFYDGMRAERQNALVDYVSALPVGTVLELTIWRDGEEGQVSVHLVDMGNLNYKSVESIK